MARHALSTNLGTPFTWAGVVMLVLVTLLGPVASLRSAGRWAFEPSMLVAGFAFGAILAFRSGLVEQRAGALQTYLRANFVTPVEHMVGLVLSLLVTWLAFAALTFVVALVVSLGDLGLAAWMAWVLLLVSGLLLPFVLIVECGSELRTPLFVPAFLYFVALLVLNAIVGPEYTGAVLGLDLDPAAPRSSLPLAARAALLMVFGFAGVVAGTWARGRIAGRGAAGRSAAKR